MIPLNNKKAIEVSGLTKYYGPSTRSGQALLAVDHISFEVPQGQVFGFLGPNGAGKTTTIRMLTGLTRPSQGQACVLGYNLATDLTRIKKIIGVVPETSNLYHELSAQDNLVFVGQLYGVPRRERGEWANALLRRFRLWEKRDTPFGKLSKGMKRALTVAAALVHRPQLVFLDEPTTGLDILSAHSLRALIGRLREEGVTVFLTTHYLEEAERLCDQIALIVKGRLVALDTVEGLKGRVRGRAAVEVTVGPGAGEARNTQLRFAAQDVTAALRLALDEAERQGRPLLSVRTVGPTLEDAFIELTGISAEVMMVEKGNQ
jgi:ABC-2 type transport system ATP-binding protein